MPCIKKADTFKQGSLNVISSALTYFISWLIFFLLKKNAVQLKHKSMLLYRAMAMTSNIYTQTHTHTHTQSHTHTTLTHTHTYILDWGKLVRGQVNFGVAYVEDI